MQRLLPALLASLALAPVAVRAQAVDTVALEAHAAFLANDSLRGRANGTPGQRMAAEYIVEQLWRMRVEGAFGSFYRQEIPLTRFDVDQAATRLVVRRGGRTDTIPATGFHHQGGAPEAFRAFDGELLDLGASTALARALPDARRVRGRVVAVSALRGGSLPALLDSLQARGVRAAIVVLPDSGLYRRLRNARGNARFHVRDTLGGENDRRMPVLLASPDVGRSLGLRAPDASAPPVAHPLGRIRLETRATTREVVAANVTAMIDGTDHALQGEPVVFVAHFDHAGVGAPVAGDSVYNGFMDNAVGVAALLGAAKVLQARPAARPVMFLFVAAEEEGSLGSAYLARHPPMPLDRAMVVNVDHPAPLAPPKSWFLEGDSALAASARTALAARGWTAEHGPAQPNSDHWSFLSRGIPALFLVPGEGWEGVTPEQEAALIARWWRPHQPDDEWSPDFPVAGLARTVEVLVLLAHGLSR